MMWPHFSCRAPQIKHFDTYAVSVIGQKYETKRSFLSVLTLAQQVMVKREEAWHSWGDKLVEKMSGWSEEKGGLEEEHLSWIWIHGAHYMTSFTHVLVPTVCEAWLRVFGCLWAMNMLVLEKKKCVCEGKRKVNLLVCVSVCTCLSISFLQSACLFSGVRCGAVWAQVVCCWKRHTGFQVTGRRRRSTFIFFCCSAPSRHTNEVHSLSFIQ